MFHVEGCEGVSNRCPISGSVDCLLTLVFAGREEKEYSQRHFGPSSLPCPVILQGVLRQQNIGAVSEGQRG